jgi:ectoine hydroxylase-related dioxygenase (phytanoyl-CoA dioxygenase family)
VTVFSAAMATAATLDWKRRFDVDGFVNFGRILDANELEALRERVDRICDGSVPVPADCLRFHSDMAWEVNGVRRPEAVWQVLGLEQHDALVREICEKPLIREVLETLLEGPVRLWSSQVIMKNAFHGGEIPWHQDSSYWGQERRLTCWVALDDATPFNGCMRMIPGSHLKGQQQFTPKAFDGTPVNLLETDSVSEDTQVYVPVPAGCASFHHPLTLHASSANTTPNRRRAIAITYQAL